MIGEGIERLKFAIECDQTAEIVSVLGQIYWFKSSNKEQLLK